MKAKVKFLGHPVHPMLIVFPLGLLSTGVIFDLIGLVVNDARWMLVAFYLIGAGVIGGLAAAVFGWIDWVAIPGGTRAKRIGLWHGVGNVVVLGLFILSWLLRRDMPPVPPTGAVVASIGGLVLALVTGWLGGELVDRLGVGVDDGAHVNSPSSLSALPAGTDRSPVETPRYVGRERRVRPVPSYPGVERRRTAGAR